MMKNKRIGSKIDALPDLESKYALFLSGFDLDPDDPVAEIYRRLLVVEEKIDVLTNPKGSSSYLRKAIEEGFASAISGKIEAKLEPHITGIDEKRLADLLAEKLAKALSKQASPSATNTRKKR